MNPPGNELLTAILMDAASEKCHRETLERGLLLVRAKRARRQAGRTVGAFLSLVGLALLILWPKAETEHAIKEASVVPISPTSAPKMIAGTPISVLSDQELLNLFKDRPLALVGQPGHQKLFLLDEGPN